jgi:hypothetical protein
MGVFASTATHPGDVLLPDSSLDCPELLDEIEKYEHVRYHHHNRDQRENNV